MQAHLMLLPLPVELSLQLRFQVDRLHHLLPVVLVEVVQDDLDSMLGHFVARSLVLCNGKKKEAGLSRWSKELDLLSAIVFESLEQLGVSRDFHQFTFNFFPATVGIGVILSVARPLLRLRR